MTTANTSEMGRKFASVILTVVVIILTVFLLTPENLQENVPLIGMYDKYVDFINQTFVTTAKNETFRNNTNTDSFQTVVPGISWIYSAYIDIR